MEYFIVGFFYGATALLCVFAFGMMFLETEGE